MSLIVPFRNAQRTEVFPNRRVSSCTYSFHVSLHVLRVLSYPDHVIDIEYPATSSAAQAERIYERTLTYLRSLKD